jgi:hypothetical protein
MPGAFFRLPEAFVVRDGGVCLGLETWASLVVIQSRD